MGPEREECLAFMDGVTIHGLQVGLHDLPSIPCRVAAGDTRRTSNDVHLITYHGQSLRTTVDGIAVNTSLAAYPYQTRTGGFGLMLLSDAGDYVKSVHFSGYSREFIDESDISQQELRAVDFAHLQRGEASRVSRRATLDYAAHQELPVDTSQMLTREEQFVLSGLTMEIGKAAIALALRETETMVDKHLSDTQHLFGAQSEAETIAWAIHTGAIPDYTNENDPLLGFVQTYTLSAGIRTLPMPQFLQFYRIMHAAPATPTALMAQMEAEGIPARPPTRGRPNINILTRLHTINHFQMLAVAELAVRRQISVVPIAQSGPILKAINSRLSQELFQDILANPFSLSQQLTALLGSSSVDPVIETPSNRVYDESALIKRRDYVNKVFLPAQIYEKATDTDTANRDTAILLVTRTLKTRYKQPWQLY